MTADTGRGVVVLFGGLGRQGDLGDTWEWNGLDWNQPSTPTAPRPRYSTDLAYDAVRGRVVLYGGHSSTAGRLGDLWEWDGATWVGRAVAGSDPGRRAGHRMTFDAARGRVVLFGGIGLGLSWFDDVWEFDGAQWSDPSPAVRPPAVRNPSMTYDSSADRCVLYGGDLGLVPNTDVWEWDGTTWQRTPSAPNPGARLSAGLAYDRARRRLVLHGGDADNETWLWDRTAATWSRVPYDAPPQQLDALVANDWAGRTLFHVGTTTLLWHHATSSWERLATAARPQGYGGAMAFDPARQEAVLFGGPIANPTETWIWSAATRDWQQRSPAGSPPQMQLPAMAHDFSTGRTVLFGAGPNRAPQTWEWDGVTWTRRQPANSPSGRIAAAMGYDLATGVVLLFGGRAGSFVNDDVWEWDGADWTQRVTVNQGPSPRGAAAMCMRGDGVLIVGGNDQQPLGARFDDVWLLTGDVWTQVPSGPLPPASPAQAAYDLSRQELVVFGGQTTGNSVGGVWILGVPPARVVSLGGGCAGSQGRPQLAARGLPTTGNAGFAVDATGLSPQQPVALVAGLDTSLWALPGACRVFVAPTAVTLTTATAAGAASLPLPVPAVAGLSGLQVGAQAVALDPGAAAGLAVTPALELRVGR